jgi:gliding motility-associated-like protein
MPIQLVATGGVDYTWRPDPTLSATNIANPIATPTDTSWYYVTVYNVHQCHADDSIHIDVQTPVTAVAQSPYNICVGNTVQLSASGGFFYLWTPATWLSSTVIANPISIPDSTITYTVKVSNNCFSSTATVDVIVHQPPYVDAGDDTTIYRNTDAILNGVTDGTSYYWYPNDALRSASSLSTIASPLNTTIYYLYSVSAFGCSTRDSVLVTVDPYFLLQIPTAFSPNDDGVNDIFHIIRSLNVKSIEEFAVFDRWGQKVFSTDMISEGWDGNYKGHKQDIGVYVWYVKGLTYDNQEVFRKGNVTLIR